MMGIVHVHHAGQYTLEMRQCHCWTLLSRGPLIDFNRPKQKGYWCRLEVIDGNALSLKGRSQGAKG